MTLKGTKRFKRRKGQDTILRAGVSTSINTRHQCITAMTEYQDKSLEELRLEDYLHNCKRPNPWYHIEDQSLKWNLYNHGMTELPQQQNTEKQWTLCKATKRSSYEKVSQQAGGSFITKNISNLQINNPVDIVPQQGTFCTSDRSSDVYQPKTTKEEEEICVCMCGLKFTAEPKPGDTVLDKLSIVQGQNCCDERLFGALACHLTNFHVLAAILGFTWCELEAFRQNHPASPPTQRLEMLVTWKQRQKQKATLYELLKALQRSHIPEVCYRKQVLEYLENWEEEACLEDQKYDTVLDMLSKVQGQCCPDEGLFGMLVCHLTNFHVLAVNLGFTWSELEAFRQNHPTSPPTQRLEMLVTWKQRQKEKATLYELLKAFQRSHIPEVCYREQVLEWLKNWEEEACLDYHKYGADVQDAQRP